MDTLRKYKREIIVGTFAGLFATIIFIYLLDPIITFLGTLFIKVGSNTFESIVNRLYKEIAVGYQDYSYLFFRLSIFFIVLLGTLMLTYSLWIKPFKRELTDEEVISEKRKLKKLLVVLHSSLLILSIILLVFSSIKKKTLSSFDQHIKIIKPYTEHKTIEFIISDFSRMKSLEDYKKVQSRIDSIALANNINLPDNKLY